MYSNDFTSSKIIRNCVASISMYRPFKQLIYWYTMLDPMTDHSEITSKLKKFDKAYTVAVIFLLCHVK